MREKCPSIINAQINMYNALININIYEQYVIIY